MKVTDYAPRAAPFDSYLRYGRRLVGAEIGVDVGAHAQALLQFYDIDRLYLIDPWQREYQWGYCDGRLAALGFSGRFELIAKKSLEAAKRFAVESLDFLYFDQEHEGQVVGDDLITWWPKLKRGGHLGYRNYGNTAKGLTGAVDAFIARLGDKLEARREDGEMVLIKR